MQITTKSKGFITLDPNEQLVFKNSHFINEAFSNKKLRWFDSVNSQFENCQFEHLIIKDNACFGAGPHMSVYTNCSFDHCTFAAMVVGRARFVNCTFRHVNIKQFFAHEAEFIQCVFSGKLKKALFYGKVWKEDRASLGRDINEVRDNDFSQLEMTDVGFRNGVDLTQQKLPTGEDYLYLENPGAILQEAKRLVSQWSEGKLKRKAEAIVKIGEEELADGQQQQFFIKRDLEIEIFNLLKQLAHS